MRNMMFLSAAAIWAFSAPFATAQHEHDAKPWSQADAYWDDDDMDDARSAVLHHHGDSAFLMFNLDRLEWQSDDEEDMAVWDGEIWYGGDINKLTIKSEGEYSFEEDELEEAEIQLLWSRAISPYWDLQTGLRYDLEPKGRTHAVLGFQGMAPYRFEVDGAFFLSSDGELSASAEVEYELMLTQRLELSPRLELGWSAKDIPELETGQGFTDAALGLRLSYDVIREFSPYVGVEWQSALGDTKDMMEAAGGETDRTVFLIGLRAWY